MKRVPVCLALQIQCSIDTLVQCTSKKTIATRFPFLCQDRFFLRCFGGSKTGPKNGTKKGTQNGPQMDPKRDPRGTKMGLKTGSRKGSRKGYPSGRVNSEILLLFTVFQQGRASQKSITFGTTFGTILGPKVSKRGVLKSTSKIGAKMAPFWDPFGTHLGSTWSQNRVNKGTPKAKRLQGPSEDLKRYHFGPQNR